MTTSKSSTAKNPPPAEKPPVAACSGACGPYCTGLRDRFREYMHEGGGLGVTRQVVWESGSGLPFGTPLFILKGRPKSEGMVMNYCPFCGESIRPGADAPVEERMMRSIQELSGRPSVVVGLVKDTFSAWVANGTAAEDFGLHDFKGAREALRALLTHFQKNPPTPASPEAPNAPETPHGT